MSRDSKVYLQDIADAAELIETYIVGHTLESFSSDTRTRDAVIRNLEIIGEAANHVPEEFRKSHATVEWRKLVDLRNLLIHEYFGVDTEIVWDLSSQKLPDLKISILEILRTHPGQSTGEQGSKP